MVKAGGNEIHRKSDLLSRPLKKNSRPRPWSPGLENKTKTLVTRSPAQDFGHQVSRPRPWSPGLETKTLVTGSQDQDPINRHRIETQTSIKYQQNSIMHFDIFDF